ncbi:MAG: tetratricopeptide repeat protein [Proteobacteria bacterium]|nr:tetratricopeptide repeat protein [Pseudomonadota bacterium]
MRALTLVLALCLSASLLLPGCTFGVSGGFIFNDADQRRAIEIYKAALAKNPDDWMLHRRLGLAYFDLKDYVRAEQSLQTVQTLSPGEPESLLYLGLSRIGKGEREAGLKELLTYRWPGKFYHQKFVQEEAARLRNHPEEPAPEVIRDILEALKKGQREQLEMERDRLGGWR